MGLQYTVCWDRNRSTSRTGGKGISCMATGTMPEKCHQYLEGMKHPPSYLCTGQEVQWNQPNQKHQDSKATPARAVVEHPSLAVRLHRILPQKYPS